ncbi:hypothetical protein [uncultured phage]|nr:hypothetical protein [uncultured phage]
MQQQQLGLESDKDQKIAVLEARVKELESNTKALLEEIAKLQRQKYSGLGD